MPTNYKVLGQVAPSASVDTTLYTVPSQTQTVVSSIVVTNQSASADSFRLAVRPDGASLQTQHYLAYDANVSANSFVTLTLGLTADASDVVTVSSDLGQLSFNAFGSEITA